MSVGVEDEGIRQLLFYFSTQNWDDWAGANTMGSCNALKCNLFDHENKLILLRFNQ